MTTIPALSTYDIRIFDHDGNFVWLLNEYEYLEFSQRINDSWNHNIRINKGYNDPDLVMLRSFERDYIIQIRRTDPVLGTTELVYEGFHRTTVDQVKMDGSVIITMYGTGYTNLLKRRVIVPPAGQENSIKSGVAETIIKEFVDEQCVSAVDPARIIPGLSIETDASRGGAADYSARYTNLFTAVSRCAEQGLVDFGVVGGANRGEFELQVRDLWGSDRRVGNTAGNVPTKFDVTLNNMLIPILSRRGTDEVNFVFVGGQGEGINRTIQEEQNATAMAVSPWNRSEAFVDARNESAVAGLTTRGQAYLQENRARIELTFNIQQTLGTRWLRDWELGDLVTAVYGGYTFEKKIVEVSVVVSAGTTGQAQIEVISLEMEDIV